MMQIRFKVDTAYNLDTKTALPASISDVVEGEDTMGVWVVVRRKEQRDTSTFAVHLISFSSSVTKSEG